MTTTPMSVTITNEEKVKVAYALNLCAASITQIIDSKDIVVLKQERELILGNLNIQNFVKHPALLDWKFYSRREPKKIPFILRIGTT